MKLHQLVNVELGCLQDFRLAHVHVLERVNASRRLLNLTSNCLRDELLHQVLQVTVDRLARHDLEHLFPDFPYLTRLCVSGLLHLRWASLGEADGEKSEEVAVSRLDVDVGFNEGLPFANKGAKFVGRKVHAMEICQAVLALDFVDSQAHFAEGLLLVLVEITQ